MAYGVNDIVYHVNSLRRRVSDLETLVYEDTAEEENSDNLKVGTISHTVSYNHEPTPEGQFTAEVVWSWVAPPAPDSDDLDADPVVDYFTSVSVLEVAAVNNNFFSTKGATTITYTQPINTTAIFRVYAVTKKGSKGPIETKTVVLSKGPGKPVQPSIPLLEAVTGSVVVKHDGNNVDGIAYGREIKHLEVHRRYGNDDFTPSTSTLHTIIPVRGSTSIGANSDYDPITVKFIAVDVANTASVAGGYATATPKKVIESDMGIPVVQNLPYTQYDNLIVNGSFEDNQLNALIFRDSVFTFKEDTALSYHGDKCLQYKGDGRTTELRAYLNKNGPEGPLGAPALNAEYAYRVSCQVRTLGWDTNGEFGIFADVKSASGVTSTYSSVVTQATSEWTAFAFTIPKGNVQARFYIKAIRLPTATVLADAAHCTHIVGSTLIEHAAIGSAHIEDLAVNDAKIASLGVGKLLAGEIATDQHIAAGPQEGIHARMSPEGFSAYNFDDDGRLYKSTSLGSSVNSLVIQASNNIPVLDVNSNTMEVNAFSLGTSPAGVTSIYGTEFREHLGELDKTIAYGRISNLGVYAYNASIAQPYLELQAYLEKGFTYKIVMSGVKFNMGVDTGGSPTSAKAMQAQVRYTTGTTKVTTTSTMLFYQNATSDMTYYGADGGFGDSILFTPEESVDHNFLISYQVVSTAPAQTISGRLYGATLEIIRVSHLENTGFFREPNVPPVVVRQYTSEWVASDSATYTGSGSRRNDTKNVRQGSGNSSYGDQYGIAVFNAGALSGETGKTVAQAMTGNVTIQKVEAAVYCNFTYHYNGGYFQISPHANTAITNTVPNTTKKQFSASKGKVVWVDITSVFTTAHRGFWIGKGGSNLNQYTWFNGHQESNPPRLKITYTRRT